MAFFYIIDKKRNLHLAEGATKSYAIEKFNDNNKIRSDYAMSAIPCVHPNKFLPPELPEWMDVQLRTDNKICYKCAGETKAEPVIIEDAFCGSGFYNNNTSNTIALMNSVKLKKGKKKNLRIS